MKLLLVLFFTGAIAATTANVIHHNGKLSKSPQQYKTDRQKDNSNVYDESNSKETRTPTRLNKMNEQIDSHENMDTLRNLKAKDRAMSSESAKDSFSASKELISKKISHNAYESKHRENHQQKGSMMVENNERTHNLMEKRDALEHHGTETGQTESKHTDESTSKKSKIDDIFEKNTTSNYFAQLAFEELMNGFDVLDGKKAAVPSKYGKSLKQQEGDEHKNLMELAESALNGIGKSVTKLFQIKKNEIMANKKTNNKLSNNYSEKANYELGKSAIEGLKKSFDTLMYVKERRNLLSRNGTKKVDYDSKSYDRISKDFQKNEIWNNVMKLAAEVEKAESESKMKPKKTSEEQLKKSGVFPEILFF